MFSVDIKAFGGVFALPISVAEKLRLCSGDLIKAIIFAYRNADKEFTAEDVAKGTGLSAADAADALLFWENEGLLVDREKLNAETISAPEEQKTEETKKELFKVNPTRLSHEIIVTRLSEDGTVRELFNEAQSKLGRTLGDADMSSLLNLYDYYGLPAEVIMCICEYARLHKKERNMGYIYKIGVDWSSRGIDTIDAAGDELIVLESINENWARFADMVGLKSKSPTGAQQKYLDKWLGQWKFTFEMLGLAFDEAVKNTGNGSLPYINKILENWYSAGVDTPDKVKENELRFREEQVKKAAQRETAKKDENKKKTASLGASYDINRAEEKMNKSVPKLKKKEKH